MERREFLRQAAVGAAGLMLSETEKQIVDPRLAQKVTCAYKGTALSDLCEHLRAGTGIQVAAGPSVADEKVTLFCEKRPLREVMRQLSRPFGYTWIRSKREGGEYRYELAQDLRGQLLEEELRNRDRNAALLAFEQEIEKFRPFLDLSPDEALAKSKTVPPAVKPLLESLAGVGWGPIQMYFRLSPQQMAALRSGQKLTFSETPEKPDEYPLPREMARGVLQCNRAWRVIKRDDGGVNGVSAGEGDSPDPKSAPLTAIPEVRARMYLTLSQSELGQFALGGGSGYIVPSGKNLPNSRLFQGAEPYVVGASPGMGASSSASGAADARLARDSALRSHVSVQPQPSCNPPIPSDPAGKAPEPKVIVADVLEASHQTTRMPIVADQYTRLFKPETVSVTNQPLFEALNRISEPMRLRWNKDGDWLQFRSASFYNDRPKEVPHRLLTRWAAAQRQHGLLSLEDLVEIAQLTDAQLDGAEMAEGAVDCWGLKEWFLVRNGELRPHVRFLAEFTPSQRQEMRSAAGLPFTKMTLAQQQGFLTRALEGDETPLQSLDELAGATLRVDYTRPGWYQWIKVGELRAVRWAVGVDQGRRVLMPPVRASTPQAALRTARQLFPPVTEAMVQAWRRYGPDVTAEKLLPQPEEIAPTELDMVIVYIPSLSTALSIRWVRPNQSWRQK